MVLKVGQKVVLKKRNKFGKPLVNGGKTAILDYVSSTIGGFHRVIIKSTGRTQTVTSMDLRKK